MSILFSKLRYSLSVGHVKRAIASHRQKVLHDEQPGCHSATVAIFSQPYWQPEAFSGDIANGLILLSAIQPTGVNWCNAGVFPFSITDYSV
jgi:hypothetical protein